MSTTTVRRLAVALVGLASVAAGTYGVLPADGAPAGAAGAAGAATHRSGHRTALTLQMPGCDDCVVQLYQGRGADNPRHSTAWISREKRVVDEKVSWNVLSRRTPGMSITVRAPWEGEMGYLTTIVMRYRGESVGDHVSFREARSKHRAAACWEGTRRDAVTLPVVVRRVPVEGVSHHRVPGSIAYLPTTTSWLTPMFPVRRGVLGLQDVATCI